LDVNGNALVSSSNGDIEITPNGSGSVVLDGLSWPQADGSSGQKLQTDGSGNLTFEDDTDTGITDVADDTTPQLGGDLDVNGNSIVSVSDGNIPITPNGSGAVILDGLSWPISDGTDGQVLTTDGAGNLLFETAPGESSGIADVVEDTSPQLGGDLDVNGNAIVSASDGNIVITPNGTGDIVLDGVSWPQADGTSGQVLQTDGAAQASWVSLAISDISDAGALASLDTVDTAQIDNESVTADQIAADAVTAAKIADDAVTSDKIATNAVTTDGLDADAVTGAQIADDAVDSEHLAARAVDRPALDSRSVNAQTGTSYTLVLADENGVVTMNNASANVLTVPTNASVAYPTGAQIDIAQIGAGATTITGDTGVTVNGVSAGSGVLNDQFTGVSLIKLATNTWLLLGAHGGVS
jgi:hypothetical protein